MVAREGIEPPTRGFSARFRRFQGFINQSLAASCRPLPRHTKAQSWHTHSELVTFLAQDQPLPSNATEPTANQWSRLGYCPLMQQNPIVREPLDERKAVLLEGHPASPFAGRRKDRVGERRSDCSHAHLACPSAFFVAGQDRHVDIGHLRERGQRKAVEV